MPAPIADRYELTIGERTEMVVEYPDDHLEARDPLWTGDVFCHWDIFYRHERVAQMRACIRLDGSWVSRLTRMASAGALT